VLWRDVARLVRPCGVVHVMDLFRPRSVNEARDIVEAAAGDEGCTLEEPPKIVSAQPPRALAS